MKYHIIDILQKLLTYTYIILTKFYSNSSEPNRKSQKKSPEISKVKTAKETNQCQNETPEINRQPNEKAQLMKNEDKTLKVQSIETVGIDYNPTKKRYDPVKDAFWKPSEKCVFNFVFLPQVYNFSF